MKFNIGNKIKFSKNINGVYGSFLVHTEDEFKIIREEGYNKLLCIKASGKSIMVEGKAYTYISDVEVYFIPNDIQLEFDF